MASNISHDSPQSSSRLTPLPPQPFVKNLCEAVSDPFRQWIQHPQLGDATITIWSALNPRPIRKLTDADVKTALEGMDVWERYLQMGVERLAELRGPTGGYIALEIICALRHSLQITYVPEDLITRSRALRRRVLEVLVSQKRENSKSSDVGILGHWAKQIEKEVLAESTTSLSLHWPVVELSYILDLLEVWPIEDLDTRIIQRSNIGNVLYTLLAAPCIPRGTISPDPRSRITEIISKWSEMGLVDFALEDSQGIASPYSTPFECRLDEIVDILSDFDNVCKSGDEVAILAFVSVFQEWRTQLSDFPLKMNIISFLTLSSKKAPAASFLVDIIRPGPDPVPAPGFQGYSYSSILAQSPQEVVFTDITPPSRGTWDPIILTVSANEPLQRLFETFFNTANSQNRHPLFPMHNCLFHIGTSDLDLTPGKWVQGTLKPADTLVEYIRGPDNDSSYRSPQVITHPAWKRILPAHTTHPAAWVSPLPFAGAGDSFTLVPSLCFVGSGSELHSGARYPPVIAQGIWVPVESKWEDLGVKMWNIRTRNPCVRAVVSAPKYVLDRDDTLGLLGRTIQYGERIGDGSVQVFVAFVWGVDLEQIVLKVFENYRSVEITRTLLCIDGEHIDQRSDDVFAPFRPVWIGAVDFC